MKKLTQGLLSITKTQTIKDAAIITLGMGFSTIFSAASIFILARILGPTKFGLYSVALTIVIIVIDSLDLAINSSIIKFASSQSSQVDKYVKYGFNLKLFLGLTIGLLFALISQPLAAWLHPDLQQPLLIASLFIPIVFLLRLPRSLLQAQKKFLADTSVEVLTSFFRLSAVVGFYFFFKLTIITSLFAYLFGATAALIISASLISWQFLKAKVTPQTKARFFSFQKWLTLSFILAAVHSRIDTAILLRLAGPSVTGIYQAGYRFFMPAIQLSVVLSLVFAPRFASFSNQQEAKAYLLKAARLALGLGVLVLLIIPFASFFINLIFGADYQTAVLPTQILSFGFAAFIAGAPFVSYLIYSIAKTKAFFFVNLLQLFLIVSLNLLLVPKFQAVGAALASSLSLISINGLLAILAFKSSPA